MIQSGDSRLLIGDLAEQVLALVPPERYVEVLYFNPADASFPIGFNLFAGASPSLAVLNPVFWGLTLLWFAGKPAFIEALFPGPVLYAGLLCFAVGNFSMVYLNLISVRADRRPELLGAALLTPVYWLMMSLAGIKAVVQLLLMPSYWEKTAHGLSRVATGHPIVEPQPLGTAPGGP